MNTTINEYLDDYIFWNREIANTDWSDPDLVQSIIEDEQIMKHCSADFYAAAMSYAEDHELIGSKERITYIPGKLGAHAVDLVINGAPLMIELPEVEVVQDDKPYVTYLENVDRRDLFKAFSRALAYCYRLNIPTGRITTIAMRRGKFKWSTIVRFQSWARRIAGTLKTQDFWLADWFEQAVKQCCNSVGQMWVLKFIYLRAAKYNTKQPRICKKTIAIELGVNRQVIRRLFDRLIKAGLMTEQPEGYRNEPGFGAKSEARIINLDPSDLDRWSTYDVLPTINRTKKNDTNMTDIAPVIHLENERENKMIDKNELEPSKSVRRHQCAECNGYILAGDNHYLYNNQRIHMDCLEMDRQVCRDNYIPALDRYESELGGRL